LIQVATNDGALVLYPPTEGTCQCCGRQPEGGIIFVDVTALPAGAAEPSQARVPLCGDCVATAMSVHLSALELRPCPHRERQG
jgi:hypothetical protein